MLRIFFYSSFLTSLISIQNIIFHQLYRNYAKLYKYNNFPAYVHNKHIKKTMVSNITDKTPTTHTQLKQNYCRQSPFSLLFISQRSHLMCCTCLFKMGTLVGTTKSFFLNKASHFHYLPQFLVTANYHRNKLVQRFQFSLLGQKMLMTPLWKTRQKWARKRNGWEAK